MPSAKALTVGKLQLRHYIKSVIVMCNLFLLIRLACMLFFLASCWFVPSVNSGWVGVFLSSIARVWSPLDECLLCGHKCCIFGSNFNFCITLANLPKFVSLSQISFTFKSSLQSWSSTVWLWVQKLRQIHTLYCKKCEGKIEHQLKKLLMFLILVKMITSC